MGSGRDVQNAFVWFLIGMGAGAALALLYAPYKGKEMRRMLSKTAEDTRDYLSEHAEELYEKGRDLVDEAAQIVEKGRKLART